LICPWAEGCAARAKGDPATYPRKEKKAARPSRRGVAFVLTQGEAVLLRRRPETGLLAGMAEPPGTPWRAKAWTEEEALAHAPCAADWRPAGGVEHVFTHFVLSLDVWTAAAPARFAPENGWWAQRDTLAAEALPSVMRKVVERGLAA
jgi:A/G-specific adenine glycosylase